MEFNYGNTQVELPAEYVDELRVLNHWNLEGRYPDYLNKISKQADEKYTLAKYENVKKIRKCLL